MPTKRPPSLWEHVDSRDSNTQVSSRKSDYKSNMSCDPPKECLIKVYFPYKDKIMSFMHEFIEKLVEVFGDGHCGFRSVADLRDMCFDDYQMIHYQLLKELTSKDSERYG